MDARINKDMRLLLIVHMVILTCLVKEAVCEQQEILIGKLGFD